MIYAITERGFTHGTIIQNGTPLVQVQCSSAMDQTRTVSGCLRDCEGGPEPGTSFLWLSVFRPGNSGEKVSAHLDRKQVADMAAAMTRWLATGFIENGSET